MTRDALQKKKLIRWSKKQKNTKLKTTHTKNELKQKIRWKTSRIVCGTKSMMKSVALFLTMRTKKSLMMQCQKPSNGLIKIRMAKMYQSGATPENMPNASSGSYGDNANKGPTFE